MNEVTSPLLTTADTISLVIVQLHAIEPNKATLDAMEYLRQAERLIRGVVATL